jgi:hypothetical protein
MPSCAARALSGARRLFGLTHWLFGREAEIGRELSQPGLAESRPFGSGACQLGESLAGVAPDRLCDDQFLERLIATARVSTAESTRRGSVMAIRMKAAF